MAVDTSTVIAIAGLAVAVGGLVFEYLRLRMRIRELEHDAKEFTQFMEQLGRLVSANELGVRVQQTQAMATQQAARLHLTAQERAIQLQEQAANHQRLMDWIGVGFRLWDRHRSNRDEDEQEE